MKIFLECVWLGGERRKEMIGFRYFLSKPTKKFSPQNEVKTRRGDYFIYLCTWANGESFLHKCLFFPLIQLPFSFLFSFLFFPTCTYMIIFAKKNVLFFCLHIHNFFLLKKMCFIFFFNRDIIVILYQLHFFIIFFLNQTNKIFISPLSHPSN